MSFHDPLWLAALLALPFWLIHRRRRSVVPALALAGMVATPPPATWRTRLVRLQPWLMPLALALLIVALARPQTITRHSEEQRLGVDLVAVLDLSTSMLARDLPDPRAAPGPDRLSMAKTVLADFLGGRPGDRIGLVVFAARPYTAAPLTFDHDWLRTTVARLQAGSLEDGTAVGDALLAALNRLGGRRQPGEAGHASRAVILITDGRDNAGQTPPAVAAAAARSLGIRVHAIGIGSRGQAVIPMQDPLGRSVLRQIDLDLDEASLRQVADLTGGGYFRADDQAMLARVFREIDRMEKQPRIQKMHSATREAYPPWLLAALGLGLASLVLRATLMRNL